MVRFTCIQALLGFMLHKGFVKGSLRWICMQSLLSEHLFHVKQVLFTVEDAVVSSVANCSL